MRRPRTLVMLALTSALGFVAGGCSVSGDASGLKEASLVVPPPTGTLPVGRATFVLSDPARRDPFASDRRRRRILAEVYYPAVGRGGGHASYLPLRVAEALSEHRVPARVLASVRTNASVRAPARPGHFPVLVFSPGYTVPHDLYTGTLEDLASRGYVVIAVDHTYETEAVQFPNGEVVRRTLPANPRNTLDAIEARVDDVSFLLKMLPSLKRRRTLAGVDTSRLGLLGHSLGGLTAATVSARNSAVACAADLAGSVYGAARRKPFRRPFLILDGGQRESTLAQWWANLAGTRYWVMLTKAKHLDFTDWSWLVPALETGGLKPRVGSLGTIGAKRAVALQRRYLGAFFDSCLKGTPTSAFTTAEPGVVVKR